MSKKLSFPRPSLSKALATAMLGWVVFAPALAATPEEEGLAIAEEADRRDKGFGDWTADVVMTLTNRSGQSSERHMRMSVLEVQEDGDKSLIVFDRPRDIDGTALLSFAHKVEDDDQWLYLPALKRVKRISSSNQSGSFVGSEFAYEDLTAQEVEKYTYKKVGEETLNGVETFVVERVPAYDGSGYTRQVTWIDQEHYRLLKVDFYDRKESLLKTLEFKGYQQYLDQFWRADEMVMTNHQTGKGTTLSWDNYRFQSGLSDSDFSVNALKRQR